MLSATLCDDDQIIRTEMVKNGVQLVAMYGDTGLLASHTIMVSLEQNDMVWVRHFNEGTSIAYSRPDRYYTSFFAMQHFLTTFTVSPFHFGLTDFHPYYLINVIEYRTHNPK
jgi:hypothetical protein